MRTSLPLILVIQVAACTGIETRSSLPTTSDPQTSQPIDPNQKLDWPRVNPNGAYQPPSRFIDGVAHPRQPPMGVYTPPSYGADQPLDPTSPPTQPLHALRLRRVYLHSGAPPVDGAGAELARARAAFATILSAPECRRETVAGCVLERCRATGAARLHYQSAGGIAVRSRRSLALVPNGDGSYTPVDESTALWEPGDPIDVTAAGADVPGFSVALLAPSNVELTAPAIAPDATLSIDRERDLEFAWSGGTSGTITISLRPGNEAEDTTLLCQFPARDGSGAVPAEALARLAPGSAQLSILPLSGDQPLVADAQVQVFAVGSVLQGGRDMSENDTTLH